MGGWNDNRRAEWRVTQNEAGTDVEIFEWFEVEGVQGVRVERTVRILT